MARAQNLVNLESVTAHVPGDASRVLLDAVSLGVERGERIGVVGLNGGGKTTLLDILAGRREPQGGRVLTGLLPVQLGGDGQKRMKRLAQQQLFKEEAAAVDAPSAADALEPELELAMDAD